MTKFLEKIDDVMEKDIKRLEWLRSVRPASFASMLAKMLRKGEPRFIYESSILELFFYIDPLSNFGASLIQSGNYEPDTARIIFDILMEGNVFIDIGANEGVFSCLAGKRIGVSGRVIAVEPQSRLRDMLRINLALNGIENCEIVTKALSNEITATLSLFPTLNTGASSLVNSYRWSRRKEVVSTISFDTLLSETGIEVVDLVKIDVEGYEKEVVDSMLPAVCAGKIRHCLLDYHASILKNRNIKPENIHNLLVRSGMKWMKCMDSSYEVSGFKLYYK